MTVKQEKLLIKIFFLSGGEGLETDPYSISRKAFFPAQSGILLLPGKVSIEQLM